MSSVKVERQFVDILPPSPLHYRATLITTPIPPFNVARGRYKAGVGKTLELLNAQSTLASAQQQRIQAMSNWRAARVKLAASLGRLGMWAIQ